MWITFGLPMVPSLGADDSRGESEIVLIETVGGGIYTARNVILRDDIFSDEYSRVWEVEGPDGYQFQASEVIAWQPITRFAREN